MKRIILTALGFLLAGPTLAQTAQQPSKEQMQAAMARQMQMMSVMFDLIANRSWASRIR
jgi:hypothetical protein